MRRYNISWRPIYLNNKVLLVGIAVVFAGMNVVILVETSLPKYSGQIASFWWPVTVAVCVAISIVYWGILRFFQVQGSPSRAAMASKVGFQVEVFETGDNAIPPDMDFAMHEAKMDGGNRRVQYKVRRRK